MNDELKTVAIRSLKFLAVTTAITTALVIHREVRLAGVMRSMLNLTPDSKPVKGEQ